MLLIVHPSTFQAERRYILDVVIKEFLGLDYEILEQEQNEIQIMLADDANGRKICMPDVMFGTTKDNWLTPDSLPKQPLEVFDVSETRIEANTVSPQIPVIYGLQGIEGKFFSEDKSQMFLGLDIFGSTFFMLTRYEEFVKKEKDNHDRFPANASLAFKESFLQRPIINEYIEILWWALRWLNPRLKRKLRKYRLDLTHDVDWPMTDSQGIVRVSKSSIADIIRRREPSLALKRLSALCRPRSRRFNHDVNNTFDYIMTISESHNICSVFNIIAGGSAGRIDGNYSLKDPWIRELLHNIHSRGHRLGLHPSYNSFRDQGQTLSEFKHLLAECEKMNINQSVWGARQHFLRFENPVTWQNMDYAGITYDSTLSYADQPGFRCGVCYEYPVFNLRTRTALKLRERPLIIMEGTLFNYVGMSNSEASALIIDLSNKCKLFNGMFTILWHNCALITKQSRRLYKNIIQKV